MATAQDDAAYWRGLMDTQPKFANAMLAITTVAETRRYLPKYMPASHVRLDTDRYLGRLQRQILLDVGVPAAYVGFLVASAEQVIERQASEHGTD